MTAHTGDYEFATQLYRSGQLNQAEQVLRQLLRVNPEHVHGWCLLGIVCRARGEMNEAAASYQEALRLSPDFAQAHSNLGNLYFAEGRLDEARASYERALQLKPDFAQAHNNLGAVLRRQGKLDESASRFRHALQLWPDFADAHTNLGETLLAMGKFNDAVPHLQHALKFKPDNAATLTNLGVALNRLGRIDEAVAQLRLALTLNPNSAEAHYNLASVLVEQRNLNEAVAGYEQALRLNPGFAAAYRGLGFAYSEQDKLDEAVASYRQLVRLKPDADSNLCLGHALVGRGQLEEGLASFENAVQLEPDSAEAHMCRATTWLSMGNYEQGWREYEWRWKTKEFSAQQFAQPIWDGSALDGRTILVHCEQGIGDVLQFIRYAALVKERGGRVIVECPKSLLQLMGGCRGIDQLIEQGSALPDFDVRAPLLSLPSIVGTTLATVRANVPYIFADAQLVACWQRELRRFRGLKVGIAWQGNPKYPADRRRSIPLTHFEPLVKLPAVHLFSLQKDPGTEQLAEFASQYPVSDLGARLDTNTGPFMDTAAVMKCLDLVITADTAIGHLAGALGVPVWIALPYAPHWTWLMDRATSPWYPTAQLFRQTAPGNWVDVFERITAELQELAAAPRRTTSVTVEVPLGELIDKITILQIKSQRLSDAAKLRNVQTELALLTTARDNTIEPSEALAGLTAELKQVNETLWQVEDDIRECERNNDFGGRFIQLARSVYLQNDRRSTLKRQINEMLGSSLIEEKSYTSYPS
jgi:tetratricopeptide (TPR) repeat protein/post-segregation antitoxin (ccd killing protein)